MRRLATGTAAGLVTLGLVSSAPAAPARATTSSPTWAQALPGSGPAWPGQAASAVYDGATGQLLMYDHAPQCANPDWLFRWDGESWSDTDLAGPQPRTGATFFYDPSSRQVIMFGGTSIGCSSPAGTRLADSWAWNGVRWTELRPATSPPAGSGGCAAYDPRTGNVVMFGDRTGTGTDPNTWTWNGTTWTPHLATQSPPASTVACGMAYDPAHRQLVFTSSSNTAGSALRTWIWDGATWSEPSSAGPPIIVGDSAAIAYDTATDQLLLLLYAGLQPCTPGVTDCLENVNNTWAWNGSSWVELNVSGPTTKPATALAYSAGTRQLVLFGVDGAGSNATWTYAARASSFAAPTRLFGADRDATAVAISQAGFTNPHSAAAVVLAGNRAFADGITGGPLAAAKNAPLLLTPSDALDPVTAKEIQRVLTPGGTVYLLGGEAALAPAVASQVTALGYSVTRIAGADRFATAVKIADALGNPGTVFEANGLDFPDALSAAPAAVAAHGVILLTSGSAQSPATAAYLAAHPGSRTAVGGAASVADPSAIALVGRDRYDTGIMLARAYFPDATGFGIASGSGFADSVAGGVYCAEHDEPILLTQPAQPLLESTHGYLSSRAAYIQSVQVFGGTAALGNDVVDEITAAPSSTS